MTFDANIKIWATFADAVDHLAYLVQHSCGQLAVEARIRSKRVEFAGGRAFRNQLLRPARVSITGPRDIAPAVACIDTEFVVRLAAKQFVHGDIQLFADDVP